MPRIVLLYQYYTLIRSGPGTRTQTPHDCSTGTCALSTALKSLLIMREAYWLRSPMLRVLICKFGDKLKEIQISPEHGIHYVNLLRTDYLLRYGGAGVLEFFEWGGRITVRPVVRF